MTAPMSRLDEPAELQPEQPLLSIRDLRVSFPAGRSDIPPAVDGLNLDLPPAGALALVGESGSGKTVGTRAAIGLLPPSARVAGEAVFEGRDLITMPEEELRSLRGRRIGMVFQNAMEAFNPTLTLKRQLTEHLLWHKLCRRKDALRWAVEAMDRVGIPEPDKRIRMYPFQFSGGMLQRAMIAMAIVTRPALLIADEPTTALDVTVQRQVLDLLKDLRSDGLAILMITHDLGVARYTCDDVLVLRHGRVVETGRMATFGDEATEPYSRHLIESAIDFDAATGSGDETAARASDGSDVASAPTPLIAASGLNKIFSTSGGDVHAVIDVDLDIRKDEAVAVVGQSGSGKSTLARLLMGLIDATSGTVCYRGRDLLSAGSSTMREFRRSVQMVFQNPYGSLLPHLSVIANVAEPLRLHRVTGPRGRTERARELLDLVGIPADLQEHYPRQLSGGQQQRVAIARALALDPAVLVCDEPTSALDVSIQAEILDLLSGLRERLGLSLLFVTHNLAVAQRLCDRIVVMADGLIVETAPTAELFTRPGHPYTRALLSAVMPTHGDPLPLVRRPTTIGRGPLIEITADHRVRQDLEDHHQPTAVRDPARPARAQED
jgi:peptide/nickel transport system ATP-binding protein